VVFWGSFTTHIFFFPKGAYFFLFPNFLGLKGPALNSLYFPSQRQRWGLFAVFRPFIWPQRGNFFGNLRSKGSSFGKDPPGFSPLGGRLLYPREGGFLPGKIWPRGEEKLCVANTLFPREKGSSLSVGKYCL